MRTFHDPKIDGIARLELVDGLSRRQLRRLGMLADEIERPAGTELARQGAHGREALVVLDGMISIERDGHEIAVVGAGTVLGEIALLDRARRNATVTTLTPVRLLVLSVRDFQALLYEFPAMAARIEEDAAARRAPAREAS
ncbi:MAG: cyclic nucleotide-binding domain-containing protein [Actinobacteria bacterium]|nr:cyclic nucleotide-binding domain-containing protein [Actinomycetota bacterium]